jgi:nitroreductase
VGSIFTLLPRKYRSRVHITKLGTAIPQVEITEIIRNEFNIPSNLEPIAIIAVGYADTEKASPDRHSKDRKALESLVCYETF